MLLLAIAGFVTGCLHEPTLAEPAAVEPAEAFAPLPQPGPDDWLANHAEPGQTAAQFAEHANCPTAERRVIYLQPVGDWPEHAVDLDTLARFAAAWFQLEVKTLPPVTVEDIAPIIRQRPGAARQLRTDSLLNWLMPRVPADAFSVLALTGEDLYPGDGWNFVFGQATFYDRVGVYSVARFDDAFYGGRRTREVTLRRSLKLVSHEQGHMYGVTHCTAYRCNMNGSNNLSETDRSPLHLGPVCLEKLRHCGVDTERRYQELEAFYRAVGLEEEAGWVAARQEVTANETSNSAEGAPLEVAR